MPRERHLEVCALNLAANPHPEGIYTQLLSRAAKFIVKARGSDYAKITEPRRSKSDDRLYAGRILLWTEIDLDGRWLDITKEDELPKSLRDAINIPVNAKPNFRSFDYAFDNSKHTLYYESKNENGYTLGPSTAQAIISKVLSQELLGFRSPEVEVTVVPEKGAVQRILKLPRLRVLHIRLTKPNPDLADPAKQRRVFGRLDQMKAQRQEIKITRSAGADRLTPTEEIEEIAEVAAQNGFVQGEGRSADGKKVEVSTANLPKRMQVAVESGGTFIARLLASITL